MTSYFQDGDHDVILLKPLARPPRVGLLYELRYLIHSTYNRTCLWTKRFLHVRILHNCEVVCGRLPDRHLGDKYFEDYEFTSVRPK